MPYVRLERERFCQQYKMSDVLPKRSKDSLQKTPILRRLAAASHIEGELSRVYMVIKFNGTTGQKRLSPKWLVSRWRRLFSLLVYLSFLRYLNSCLANVRRNVTKPVYVLQMTLSVRICAPVITVTRKHQLMKRMMMRAMTVLVNTVTNLILNTEPFPFFDTDAIFFIHDIWERYFLPFLKISSILDFFNFKVPEMESDKFWKTHNELGYKAFLAPSYIAFPYILNRFL